MPGRVLATAFVAAWLACASTASAHDVEPPRPKDQPAATWPGGKVEAHDVVVPVTLTISVDGVVREVTVDASVSPELDAAAVAAARMWTFEPAQRDGKPVASKIRANVRFVGRVADPEEVPHVHGDEPAHMHGAEHAGEHTHQQAHEHEHEHEGEHDHEHEHEQDHDSEHDHDHERAGTVRVRGSAPPRSASEVVRGQDVIGAAPHRTASDVLSVVPGVFVTQHGGEGKAHEIFLRGFDAVHGQDIEIWVGGIPINEVSNIHGQGYSDLHFAMPEIIKEIQSTPGTYDPRQGDFAVAGTIRMRLGYDEPGVTAKGTLGSFGTKRLFLAYHPKDASDETFAAFEEYSTDGFGPNRAARRGSFVGQGTLDLGDGVAARLLATSYSGRFDSAGVLRERDIQSGAVDRFASYDPKQGGHSSRTQLLAEVHKDDEGARWSIAPFVAFRSLALRQNFTGFLTDSEQSDNSQQLHDDVMIGATASYRKTLKLLSSRDAIEAGFFARNDWIDQSQRRLSDVTDLPTQTLVDAKIRGTDVAGYVDASLFPISRLALRGGVRVDALSYTTQDTVPAAVAGAAGATPGQQRSAAGAHAGKKLTADVLLAPRLHALASYGEGFRSPQARSLSEGERTPFTEVRSYEVGVRYGQGNAFAGSLAAFHTDLTQDLAFDQASARNETTPGTQRNGLAFEMLARASDWLTMSTSATYTRATFTASDAKYASGDLLPYVPQLIVRADTVAKKKIGALWGRDLEGRVGYGVESLVNRPLPYGQMGSNVFLLDVAAGLRLKEFELGLDVTNLLDAKWYDGEFVYPSNFDRGGPAQLVPQRHVTVGPPRSVFASLTIHL